MHYTELGFVNTKIIFEIAIKDEFAVPAFNFNNMEQIQAIVMACVECQSPVILQVSKGARNYANPILLSWMGRGAVEMMKAYAKEKGVGEIPMVLHLDHGDTFQTCKDCIDTGFSSVMIDASHHPYEVNIELCKEVVAYAHKFDITVEGELGILAGVEDAVSSDKHVYTKPEEVQDFVSKTGVDSLAIAIGTSHGAFKFKPGQKPQIRMDILKEIEKKILGFPIVLHGSSSVPQDAIAMFNKYGGKLEDSIGIPEEQLLEASHSAVCKINIDSDARLVMTAQVRRVLAENPGEFDPRKYLGPARNAMKELYIHKCKDVLNSAGKAPKIMEILKKSNCKCKSHS